MNNDGVGLVHFDIEAMETSSSRVQKMIEASRELAKSSFERTTAMGVLFIIPYGSSYHSCNSATTLPVVARSFDETVIATHPLIPGLIAQWNRAKMQRNKNLMRDIEARLKDIRGY